MKKLYAVAALCFLLTGCGTTYYVKNEVHQTGAGPKTVAIDSKGELDGEQNATLPIGDGSVGGAGSLLDRITPNVLKPVSVDNSVKEEKPAEVKPEPVVEEELGDVEEVDSLPDEETEVGEATEQ